MDIADSFNLARDWARDCAVESGAYRSEDLWIGNVEPIVQCDGTPVQSDGCARVLMAIADPPLATATSGAGIDEWDADPLDTPDWPWQWISGEVVVRRESPVFVELWYRATEAICYFGEAGVVQRETSHVHGTFRALAMDTRSFARTSPRSARCGK